MNHQGAERIRSICPLRYGMTQRPQQRVSHNSESVCRGSSKREVPVAARDIATDPESGDLLLPDETLNPPPLSNPPPPPSKYTDPSRGYPELEVTVNTLPLPKLSHAETKYGRRVRTMSLPRIS